MIRNFRFFKFAFIVTFLFSCKNENKQQRIQTEEITFSKEGELYLLKAAGDTIQHLNIEIADNDYERETGLMYRTEMADDQGMLFIFENERPRSFYMKNTRIPLDILFIAADSSIVNIVENAEPMNENSLISEEPAQFVLEVNAGLKEAWNIETGDKISFHTHQQ